MDCRDASAADGAIAKLIDMGFELDCAAEAVGAVGPSIDDALEFILNGARDLRPSSASGCSTSRPPETERSRRHLGLPRRMKQTNIRDLVRPMDTIKRRRCDHSNSDHGVEPKGSGACSSSGVELDTEPFQMDLNPSREVDGFTDLSKLRGCENDEVELHWEQKVGDVLQKHFGFNSLKSFQKEALEAWLANKDCLVLAATGSGKSLCFQIPALLTSKVVVVVSPLISLMYDQCIKLAEHGISSCFLGSGQPDGTVERKAMNGMYKIIYVCPETILRLIEPLQGLAEKRGIALFAIDEVHCISKWGHDFRPCYRRLSVLRERFCAANLKFLKFDIPLMALTATATIPVREDIMDSLIMSKETKIVLTSFFRPNLRFSVKHSRNSSKRSYKKDFYNLIETYAMSRKEKADPTANISIGSSETTSGYLSSDESDSEGSVYSNDQEDEPISWDCDGYPPNEISNGNLDKNQLTVEYLEDELDVLHSVDDWDVSCGEFLDNSMSSQDLENTRSLEQGPTIIYVPTRKETSSIADFLCRYGVRAAAYHAKMPKSHLRNVHEKFHHNCLEVVVATIAFGMGIDKSNVRRIIHYGWPQSLEAYYQEAGRAGRDGKLSDCTLYANLSRVPTLLPNKRTEEQTKKAYKMLSDCYRYGMSTAICRVKTIVMYFGEEFVRGQCNLCDICVNGAPEALDVAAEAKLFLRVLGEYGNMSSETALDASRDRPKETRMRTLRSLISKQCPKFSAISQKWWQGLARLLLDKGYIKEGSTMVGVSIRCPELTNLGWKFLHSGAEAEEALYVHPEADMLLEAAATDTLKPYSSFREWGLGWADPEIRRQRLQNIGRKSKRPSSRRRRRRHQEPNTARGRIAAKLLAKPGKPSI